MTRSVTLLIVHLRKRTVLPLISAHTVHLIRARLRPWTLLTISLPSKARLHLRAAVVGERLWVRLARLVRPTPVDPRVLPRAAFPPCRVRGASPVPFQAGTMPMTRLIPACRVLPVHLRAMRSRTIAMFRRARRLSPTTNSPRKTIFPRAILARAKRNSV